MKNKLLTTLIFTFLSGAVLAESNISSDASTSSANPATATPFASLDTNKDSALSRDELQSVPSIANNFDELDFNGDGKIIESDYYALVAALDTGRAPALPEYTTLDVNRDGNVEAAEYNAFKSRLADIDKLMLSGKLGSGSMASGSRGASVQGASSDPAPSSGAGNSTSAPATDMQAPTTP